MSDIDNIFCQDWLKKVGYNTGNFTHEDLITYSYVPLKPIECACYLGNLDVCKWLFEKEVVNDINASNSFSGNTLLHYAFKGKHIHIIKFLLEKGASINAPNLQSGNTLLHDICKRNSPFGLHMCEFLFEKGADINVLNKDDSTPMWVACGKGNLLICKWLFKMGASSHITKVAKYNTTPMFIACQTGQLSVCQWLFEVGASKDITMMDNNNRTPIWIACSMGHLSICKWLFEVGASIDINKGDSSGYTPMHIACKNNHLSVCKWLYKVGADINKENSNGNTPMHIACKYNHLSICKWLFKIGIDITKKNNDGYTSIMIAFKKNHSSIYEWLIINGVFNNPVTSHIDINLVKSNIPVNYYNYISKWLNNSIENNLFFFNNIIMGTFYPNDLSTSELLHRTLKMRLGTLDGSNIIINSISEDAKKPLLQTLRPVPAIIKLRSQSILMVIADYMGVIYDKKLRNVKELASVLRSITN